MRFPGGMMFESCLKYSEADAPHGMYSRRHWGRDSVVSRLAAQRNIKKNAEVRGV